jgi:hypothetical protein
MRMLTFTFFTFFYLCPKPAAGGSLGPEYVSHFVTVCFYRMLLLFGGGICQLPPSTMGYL